MIQFSDFERCETELDLIDHKAEKVESKIAPSETPIGSLSGGNQQKVLFGRSLRLQPSVLVLDEPTRGIDVGAKEEIHQLIDQAARDNTAVLVASTDTDELVRLSHRVVVVVNGRVSTQLTGDQMTVENIEKAQLQSQEQKIGMAPVSEESAELGGPPERSIWSRLGFDRFSALYVLVAFFIFFGITEDSFLMWNGSLEFVLTDKVIVLMLALAFLVPLTTEAFDLSIGAIAALALLIVNKIALETDLPQGLGALIAMGACLVIGWLNGFLVVKLRVNSFIATLGMSQVVAAIIRNIHDGGQINGELTPTYRSFGRGDIFAFNWPGTGSEIALPWYFLYGLIITVIVCYVLEHTPTGRHMFATGGNPEAAGSLVSILIV